MEHIVRLLALIENIRQGWKRLKVNKPSVKEILETTHVLSLVLVRFHPNAVKPTIVEKLNEFHYSLACKYYTRVEVTDSLTVTS